MLKGNRIKLFVIILFLSTIGLSCKRYEDGGNPAKASKKILNRWELVGFWSNDIYRPTTRLDLEIGDVETLYWEVYKKDPSKEGAGTYAAIVERKNNGIEEKPNNSWKLSEDHTSLFLNGENHPLKLFGLDTTSGEKEFKILKLKYNKAKHVGEFIYAITFDGWTYKFVFRPD